MIRILVVDDHPLVRHGLTELLGTAADLDVVGQAADGRQAVELVDRLLPDVVLMDLQMPVLDGIDATRLIHERHPDLPVVALTSFEDTGRITAALGAGACGYLLKDVEESVLIASVRATRSGGAPLSPAVAAHILRGGVRVGVEASLTRREVEILHLLAEGQANKEIAQHLGISEKTVKNRCVRIFDRIGVADRTQAALWASRNLPAADVGAW